jgi:hypothetical protein
MTSQNRMSDTEIIERAHVLLQAAYNDPLRLTPVEAERLFRELDMHIRVRVAEGPKYKLTRHQIHLFGPRS